MARDESLGIPKPAKRRRRAGTAAAEPARPPRTDPPQSVPPPSPDERKRNLAGFDVTADSDVQRPAEKSAKAATPAKPKRQNPPIADAAATPTGRRRSPAPGRRPEKTGAMVRVHTTVSIDTATALGKRAVSTGETHTEILATAFVDHAAALADEVDREAWSRLASAGFRPRRRAQRKGRMSVTFTMSELARQRLDDAATAAGFDSRSAFVDALLRRHLDLSA